MLKRHFTYFSILIGTLFVASCGAKQYHPPELAKKAYIQIDGSKSKTGVPVFGAKYRTYLNVWKPYPKTCEEYYYGQIKIGGGRSTEPTVIPADELINIYFVRAKTTTTSSMTQTVQHVQEKNSNLFFIPKENRKYVFQMFDKERGLTDMKVFEVNGDREKEMKHFLSNPFEKCKEVKELKQPKAAKP
ncbi:MAG: hypothetical protein KDD48_06880 [Bdellovibrionales bacterium]|nr:hypothetical protein [Bdellovibrionales bacterium]